MSPILDRRPRFDVRSRDYPVRTLVGQARPEPRQRLWRPGTVLDQGAEGACVGFGWVDELLAAPGRVVGKQTIGKATDLALEIYHRAQEIDEWPGEDYEGSSVLGGAKAMQERELITGYRWCFSIEDLRDAIITTGPVVIGINWYESMYEAPEGIVEVEGDMVGGHCLVVTGYSPERQAFRWRNSWGKSYGINGNAWVSYEDMAELLEDQGEACVPVGRQTFSL